MFAKQALTAGCLATILVVIGTFTPGWTIISGQILTNMLDAALSNRSFTSFRLGLWFQQKCTTEGCVTSVYPSAMYDVGGFDMSGITEFRIYTSFGILFSIAACILTLFHLRGKSHTLTGFAALLMFLFSGTVTWLASGKMINRYVLFDDYLYEAGISDNPLQFPYSTIVCGVGGILELFCSFLVGYNMWKLWNYSADFKHKRMEMSTYF